MTESLRAMLNAPPPEVLSGANYRWEELSGRFAIQRFVGDAQVVADVQIAGALDGLVPRWYGDRNFKVTEGVRLSDGRLLVAYGGYTFAGTFASHDEYEVRYYGLVPLNKGNDA